MTGPIAAGKLVNTSEAVASWSDNAFYYQHYITGWPPGVAWQLNGVAFDGVRNGVLLMARGTFEGGAAKLLTKEWFAHNAVEWVDTARKWSKAANGVPIKYYVQDESLAKALTTLLENGEVTGITVIPMAMP